MIEISDRIYVFKDGQRTALIERKDANEDLLYEKMVGRAPVENTSRLIARPTLATKSSWK